MQRGGDRAPAGVASGAGAQRLHRQHRGVRIVPLDRAQRVREERVEVRPRRLDDGAQVIDPAEVDGDGRVVFGATVEIEDLDSGDVRRWQIVGEDEADIKHGKISITSPIARALIGRSEGDTVEVQAPGGVRGYEILAVAYR